MRFVSWFGAALLTATSLPSVAHAAEGQYASPPLGHITLHDPNSTGEIGGMTVGGRSLSARAGDTINPKDFGAIGDGNSHSAGSVLGISTLAGLAGYTKNGATPYSFIGQEPFGVRFNLSLASAASNGATALAFAGTATVGVQMTLTVANGATTVTVPDKYLTAEKAAIINGTPVSAPCLPANTTISGTPTGSAGAWVLTFSAAANSTACVTGAQFKFGVSPASGSYTLPLVFTSGVRQGDVISGNACITTGTQVDYINLVRMEARLSKPLASSCAGNTSLTFIPSWLSKVSTGMKVEGLASAIPSGVTVSSVNTSTGNVGISPGITANLVPNTAVTGVGVPTYETTPITFYRPYSDAEATALQMDRLGIQAAIQSLAASTSGNPNSSYGGSVIAPKGTYLIDGPIVMPIEPFGTTGMVSLGGPEGSMAGVVLQAVADTGPNSAVVSSGDPAAQLGNQFGIYAGPGLFSHGELHDLSIYPISYATTVGLRPTWGGTPVAMDGIKEGPRLNLRNVTINGFNAGIRAAIDHTEHNFVTSLGNFVGLKMDDAQVNLFGDERFLRTFYSGNMWAGIMVSSRNYLSGHFDKSYLGYNPYAIYCEGGPSVNGQCLTGATFDNLNAEGGGCGIIVDGSISEGYAGLGARNAAYGVQFNAPYFGATWPSSAEPAGGCSYNASFDMAGLYGLKFTNLLATAFGTGLTGQYALIRTDLTDPQFGSNAGGITLEGPGVWSIVQAQGAANQNVVAGHNGSIGYDYVGSWKSVTLKGNGWTGHPMQMAPNSLAGLSLGQVFEYQMNGGGVDGMIAVQLAGQTANAPIAGTGCQPFSVPPYANNLFPIICTDGESIPVLTAVAQALGTMVKVGTATPGTAVAATDATDGAVLGILNAATSSNLGYMKANFWTGGLQSNSPNITGTMSLKGNSGNSATVLGPRSGDNHTVVNLYGTGSFDVVGSGGIEANGGSVTAANAYGVFVMAPPPSSGAAASFGVYGNSTPIAVPGGMDFGTALTFNGASVVPLSGLSGNIGGSALTAGQCASGTVTVSGAAVGQVVSVSPVSNYPGDAFDWRGRVSSSNTVTVQVCAKVAGTPTGSTYNVRIAQTP